MDGLDPLIARRHHLFEALVPFWSLMFVGSVVVTLRRYVPGVVTEARVNQALW